MNWDDLRILLGVARAGSITKAAIGLGMDGATVGRRIARLERDLKQQLFTRSPSGYYITQAGLQLYERAKRMETELQTPIESDYLGGNVRIGAPDGMASFILPQVVHRLKKKNPALNIEVLALSRQFDLPRKEVDMAISVYPHPSKSVISRYCASYKLVLAAHQDLVDIAVNDLNATSFIGYIDDQLSDPTLAFAPSDFSPVSYYASNSILVQWNWLRQGVGVGMVHDFSLASAPELRTILPHHNQDRTYYCCRLKPRVGSDDLGELEEALISEIQNEISTLHDQNDDHS